MPESEAKEVDGKTTAFHRAMVDIDVRGGRARGMIRMVEMPPLLFNIL